MRRQMTKRSHIVTMLRNHGTYVNGLLSNCKPNCIRYNNLFILKL